ncbi:MAG: M1 family metallopeptidase [Bacteroidales bacterium]|nr:M1 family metallopeptidase [Bacteroidales bacterium]
MKIYNRIYHLWFYILPFLLSSCIVVGINRQFKTPPRPFTYPSFSRADSLRGALSSYRSCYDVKHYDLSVKFYPDRKTISGKVTFQAKAVRDFNTLQIDLYPNMRIDSIVYKGKILSYRREYGAVFVNFPEIIKAESSFRFTVYYAGKPQRARRPPWEGGVVWKKDKLGQPWIGVACEVAGSSLWWPSKDHLSDEPDSMTMHYSVPAPLYCVANGVMTDSVYRDGYITYTWKVSYPINTYNVTFYIGNYTNFALPYQSDSSRFQMSFFVLPYNLDKAKIHFPQTTGIISNFEKFYGSYPWPNDGFKLVESPYEGMEHQTAIAYGNKYKNLSYLGADYIILHETAHEWWGNSVSVADYADIWIHEGFATYSEALYVEATQGYEAYIRYLMVYAMFIKNKRPVVGPRDVNYWDYKDADVYTKGALILHTLRNVIHNDSLFKNIISTFYLRHRYGWANSQDFIDWVNQKTGKDFTPFFKQYLFNRSCPQLEWEYYYDMYQGKAYLYYRFQKINEDFTIPVRIKIDDKKYVIYPTIKWQKAEIPVTKKLQINSDFSYIAEKRTKHFEK